MLCFELLTGSTPFKGESDEETYEKIAHFNPVQTKFPNMSKHAKDLITKVGKTLIFLLYMKASKIGCEMGLKWLA